VHVASNGAALGTVNAQSTAQLQVRPPTSLAVSWALIKPTTDQGAPVGEDMSGSFNVINSPAGTITFTIDNVVGTQPYFAPLVTNFGNSQLLMVVNAGLASEKRCNCFVYPGSSSTYFGYYKLYSNSNVRAFRNGSGYTGTYVYWDNFASSVASGSGALNLSTSISPRIVRTPTLGQLAPFATRTAPDSPLITTSSGTALR
jgi:hypothetical protein